MTQIDCERLADIHGQGHPVMQQALAANKNLAGTPIKVVEFEGNNFPGAKAETGEEKKNRVVATARCRAPITTAKYAGNFFGGRCIWEEWTDANQQPWGWKEPRPTCSSPR